jgi:very-short-patch-repair endonuclease
MLADYLTYASSGGSAQEASGGAQLDSFEADVRDRLAAAGITVVPQYGVGGYRVDFAATHPQDPSRMVLAIEADGASYRESGSVRDRDRLRGEHLQRLGWQYHRLWSTNWFRDPDAEVAKVQDAYLKAVSDTEPAPAPPPDPGRASAPSADPGRASTPPVDPVPAAGPLAHQAPARALAADPTLPADPAGLPNRNRPALPPGEFR